MEGVDRDSRFETKNRLGLLDGFLLLRCGGGSSFCSSFHETNRFRAALVGKIRFAIFLPFCSEFFAHAHR